MTESILLDAPSNKPSDSHLGGRFRWLVARRRRHDWPDLAIPWTGAGLLFAVLLAAALLRQHGDLAGGYDMAYFRQAAWLISHGDPAYVTLRGRYLLGDHLSPVFYLMAWPTRFLGVDTTLLSIQSGCLAVTVVPLYAVARRVAGLSRLWATLLLGAYALYPALHNANMFEFHPEIVVVPAFVGMFLFASERRWLPYAACVVLALSAKEDMAIIVVLFGIVMALSGRRRAGVITAAAGLAWATLSAGIVMPHFLGHAYQVEYLPDFGTSTGAVLRTMLLHPSRLAHDLFTGTNATFILDVLGPVLFLPLVRPRWLLPVVPTTVLLLISSKPLSHTIQAHYTIPLIPFVFIATALALTVVAKASWPSRLPIRAVPAVTAAALIAASGGFFESAAVVSLEKHPWDLGRRTVDAQDRLAAAEVVPPGVPVSASATVAGVVALRRDLYFFPYPFLPYPPAADTDAGSHDPESRAGRLSSTQWFVVDYADPIGWTPATVDEVATRNGFVPVWHRGALAVYRRA